ncbi:MAG: hypothetical protein Q7S52_04260 [bacterium]|nr:hypothetical protein [bacterium]
MTQLKSHEQSLIAETASDQEKLSRIEAIVRDVEEKIKKFSDGPIHTLFREKEVTAQYLPSLVELEELPQEDREALLRFVGRTSTALKSGRTAGSKEWLTAFAQECDAISVGTTTKSVVAPLLEKFNMLIALHIAGEKNSNSYGNPCDIRKSGITCLLTFSKQKKILGQLRRSSIHFASPQVSNITSPHGTKREIFLCRKNASTR